MKFLVDAQLTDLICEVLHKRNHDAIHVKQLPEGDATPDKTIIEVANAENRIVVTKDSDFYYSHIAKGKPNKLLLITTGNIKNNQLLSLLRAYIKFIEVLFRDHNFIELNANGIATRESLI
ncbi:MAG: hypothetical protein EOP42_26845 [Sphingobacteriaceae bacterium]|nr:MAG: hypothetical protein EOP42_26845 [Sphingobacteriaceae bacterium]